MSTATDHSVATPAGGSFLFAPALPAETFTPEDFSDEQSQVRTTAERFMDAEVLPRVAEYEEKEPGLARDLIVKAGELGLLSILVPEKYDGLELDLTSQLVVAESVGRYASYSTTYGAHCGIGTLPLVLFGTEEQKKKYLPRLVTGEWMAAYCLSEPEAGSDALAVRTRAVLSADGKHYVLSGQKMWISNGGWADFFTVFAKIDGEKFSAFLVERGWEGVRPGAEEHKMGIHGSSTTALYLDEVQVPVENLLGEVGRGHVIAFNILNLGRLKLGASCVGGLKEVLGETIRYAKQRKAFGQAIAEFGAIQHKIAETAIRLYAAESLVYRTGGMIDARLKGVSWERAEAAEKTLAAVEEYAVECSIAKVWSSEALDYGVDEGVQVHGGYGFHADYMVERCYRDSRVNRIFEGTNEINRLLTTAILGKRAAQARLALRDAVGVMMQHAIAGGEDPIPTSGEEVLAAEEEKLSRAKKVGLYVTGVAFGAFGDKLSEQQEVASAMADIAIEIYAADSALLRARKLNASRHGDQAVEMTRVLADRCLQRCAAAGRLVIAAGLDGEKLTNSAKLLNNLADTAPLNVVAVRRRIALRLIASERYVV